MFGRIRQHLARTAGTALGLAMIAFLAESCSRDLPMEPRHSSFTPRQLLVSGNDNFADATLITTLPFTGTLDITGNTTELGEPVPDCVYYGPSNATAWFSFTPTETGWVSARLVNPGFPAVVAAYSGTSLASLQSVGCRTYSEQLLLHASAGTTYYFQVDGIFGNVGPLYFSLVAVPAPPNDGFSQAKLISTLPFSDSVDITAASVEPGEPVPSCSYGGTTHTVWYTYTPVASGSLSASDTAEFSPLLAVYTGSSLASLTEVGCRVYGALTFTAEAGTTYHFQAGDAFGGTGLQAFRLEVTPPPIASFWFSPSDPSFFDDVNFFDGSYDPGNVGIASQAWTFGDGASATGCCPTHRYAADGDYTVQLAVTTTDGRTGSVSQVVQVKTHDVAITRFTVPKAASVGQTRNIVIGVNSTRYPERVQVQFYKSLPSGNSLVGTLVQQVLVRPSNRTTDFSFSYTVTQRDAESGKVTFTAEAILLNSRDALPADNIAVSQPMKVNR